MTSLPVLPLGLQLLDCSRNSLVVLPNLPDKLQVLDCSKNRLTILPALPSHLLSFEYDCNLFTWCTRIRDAEKIGIKATKVALLTTLACKCIVRNEAAKLIQRNCHRWLETPMTNDGRLGIQLRLGMRHIAKFGTFKGQDLWTKNKQNKLIWNGRDVDREVWSLYPPVFE
jgi:hypothetical protein